MLTLPQALAPLGAYRQFILCQFMPSATRPGKTDKFPINPATGQRHDAHDPAIWLDATAACGTAATRGAGYGVGFVLGGAAPYWFLDLDNCLTNENTWSTVALNVMAALPGAAVEISQSGRGLHIFGTGTVPEHGCKNAALGLEFYHEKRFVALTGTNAVGDAATDCSAMLPHVIATYFPRSAAADGTALGWTTGPVPEWVGPADDDELIRRMMRSQGAGAVLSGRAAFADLWERNVEVLARTYPDPARPFDESSADRALVQMLAFWTGKDCARIERLARRSGLVREKWNRADYLERTILSAVAVQTDWLTDKTPEPTGTTPAPTESPTATVNSGAAFVGIPDQITMFKGCVYVSDQHRALVPGGHLIKPDQFRVRYGGYSMPMDTENARSSRDAWEVFTQSQAYRSPRADTSCFRPDLAPGAIVDEHDVTMVNTYWPIKVARKVGDAGPFLTHLAKVLPNERDRTILLSYMAACVQYIGFKIKWAPLIQGVEGNGKTLFSWCVAKAVGERYTHWPRADQISEKFNSWLFDKVFIGVEDIFVPESQAEVIEILKPMITGENLAKRAMNTDQVNANICCNFILNSNHKGAIRKTRNDRRFAMLYCAQQYESDLIRDGMGGAYFPDLYDWLRRDGYAIVSELLHTYPIPAEFDPRGACQRAPITSSTEEAIGASMGSIEQEILEAIEQGMPGFCGGWISSMALVRLLEAGRRRVSPNRQRDLLLAIGYDWHPGLRLGRVDNVVLPDGGKPKLYVRAGHPAAGLTGAGVIAAAYTGAQMGVGATI